MADIPEKIGRYKILEMIGKGAMGVVYKALDPNIDRIVAIKSVHTTEFKDAPDGEEMVQRFKREIQTAGLLTHSNIVTIYDGGVDNDVHWIAMEYIDGPSLRKMIEDKISFSFAELATMMVKICSAMEFAHKRGIVHRDLKPANILLTNEWEPKIADFGIARIESSTMTKTGVILGTPSYMSPEQVTGQRLDFRSDIFSLGIILYELMTGERPFMADNPTTIMYKIVHSDPVSPIEINPTLPKEIAEIVLRAMAKRPADRYRSCGEMANALLKLIGAGSELALGTGRHELETTALSSSDVATSFDHYEGAGSPLNTGRAKAGGGGRMAMIIIVVLVVIGAVAGGIWYMSQGANPGSANPIAGPGPGAAEITKPLSFTTNVDSADVFIDEEKVGTADGSPIEIERAEGAVVELRIEKDCHEPVTDSIVINNESPLSREYTLRRKSRPLEVMSEPSGARIAVDGRSVGTAPVEIEIECGLTYVITAESAGFSTARTEVNWETVPLNEPLTVSLAEVRMGSVEFRGGYKVTVRNERGQQLGKDVNSLSLRPGSYTLTLTNREVFLNITTSVEVKENQRTAVDLPGLGTLSIFAIPAQCTVTVDGFELGPNEMPVRNRRAVAGEHRIKFDWGSIQKEERVTLAVGGTQRVGGQRDQ